MTTVEPRLLTGTLKGKENSSSLSGEFELSRLIFYCNKFTRIWSSYTLKLIHVRFHYPFATTTTVMSPVNKKEPINGFPCILNFPVHIGTIYKLTLISSFIIWVRGYHQKTHYEAGTYLYLSQSSWLIVLGRDWKHVSCVNNKIIIWTICV